MKPWEGKSKADFEETLCEAKYIYIYILHCACNSMIDSMEGNLLETECLSVHISMLKKETQKGSRTNTQAICLSDNWHKKCCFSFTS